MPDVLIATANAGKLREIRRLTADSRLNWIGLDSYPDLVPPDESGAGFAENARIKALHYSGLSGLLALADDSGLVVDALDGAPGVKSARFAGEPSDDQANNRKLIASLADVPPERRTARFQCAMALAEPGRVLLEAFGEVEGFIVDNARGENGFGYDPHFLLIEQGRTAAELSPDEKGALSHRGRALREILPRMESLLMPGDPHTT